MDNKTVVEDSQKEIIKDIKESYPFLKEKNILMTALEEIHKETGDRFVLIIDEWLMAELKKDDVAFLFELSERRFDRVSTIFCTLYKREEWIPRLGKGTFAESIYERYAAHDAIIIDTGEMNMREIFKNGTLRETR
jgi:DNA replication protein DnaC